MSVEVRIGGAAGNELVLEFGSVREFIDRSSSRLSEEGLFVETEAAMEAGERLEFQVRVSSGLRLLKGRGEVAWRRLPGETGEAAGVAIRFLELDEPSQRLLSKVLDSHRREGKELLDLGGPLPTDESPPPEQPAPEGPTLSLELDDEDLKRTEVLSLDELPAPGDFGPVEQTGLESEELQLGEPEEVAFDEPEMVEEMQTLGEPSELPGADPSTPVGEPQIPEKTIQDLLTSSRLSDSAASPLGSEATSGEGFETQLLETLPDATPPGEMARDAMEQETAALEAWDDEESLEDLEEEAPHRSRGLFLTVAIVGLLAGTAAYYYRGPLLALIGRSPESIQQPAASSDPVAPAQQAPVDDTSVDTAPTDAAAEALPEPESAAESTSAAEAAEARAALATSVVSIRWKEEGGETALILVGNGRFRVRDYPTLRLIGPRLLVKIPGITTSFDTPRLAIGSLHLRRVRTALHTDPTGPALHVVADLTSEQVVLRRINVRGNELHIIFTYE